MSERTIYRDIRDLASTGTPIEGEAGVGYTLRAGYDLPPLMFDEEEVEALVLGARVTGAFGDERLAKAAERVLSKVMAVLPKRLEPKLRDATLFAPRTARAASEALWIVRTAMNERKKLSMSYERADGDRRLRVVRPLGAFFWGVSWTVTAWCELREDFRNFRLDRMHDLELGEPFVDEPGRTLRDFVRTLGPDAEDMLDR